MLDAIAYLGTSLFFGLLVFYFYRHYDKAKQQPPFLIDVPLRTNREALLTQKRQDVVERRSRLKTSLPQQPEHHPGHHNVSHNQKTTPEQPPENPSGDGFGEDLSAALAMSQKTTLPGKPSRFTALLNAADEFKDTYNRNNKL